MKIIKIGTNMLGKGVKFAAKELAPDILNFGAKIGNEIIEKRKNQVRIPDLTDVHIEEAVRILRDELNLVPTQAVAKARVEYANENENLVMYSMPKFGSRVDPKTTIKLYFLSQDTIDRSQELLESIGDEFEIPRVIGLKISEAREDLEALGIKVTEKVEKPRLKFHTKEPDQVTRVTYPNDKKIGMKLKKGERVWIYFIDEEVLTESKLIKKNHDIEGEYRVNTIKKAATDMKNSIYRGAVIKGKKVSDIFVKSRTAKKSIPESNEE